MYRRGDIHRCKSICLSPPKSTSRHSHLSFTCSAGPHVPCRNHRRIKFSLSLMISLPPANPLSEYTKSDRRRASRTLNHIVRLSSLCANALATSNSRILVCPTFGSRRCERHIAIYQTHLDSELAAPPAQYMFENLQHIPSMGTAWRRAGQNLKCLTAASVTESLGTRLQ